MLSNRINSVTVRNYRSLADVTVELDDLTVFVGPNGSGKSNFLDVLRFVRDALTGSLSLALREFHRTGFHSLMHQAAQKDDEILFSFDLTIGARPMTYGFVLHSSGDRVFVSNEVCTVDGQPYEALQGFFIRNGQRIDGAELLTLPLMAVNFPDVKDVFEFLKDFRFHNFIPDNLRSPQLGEAFPALYDNGDNLAVVLRDLLKSAKAKSDLFDGLRHLFPDLDERRALTVRDAGSYLVIYLNRLGMRETDLALESDGTIRLLALLTAIYQQPHPRLIGIEEPELNVHPGAAGVVADIIREASQNTQFLITTHSPDLISRFDVNSLRYVEMVDGATQISRVSDANRQTVEAGLFSSGDLLRLGSMARG